MYLSFFGFRGLVFVGVFLHLYAASLVGLMFLGSAIIRSFSRFLIMKITPFPCRRICHWRGRKIERSKPDACNDKEEVRHLVPRQEQHL